MQYFPVFLDAKQIHCLIVGAGDVASRKLELLLTTPAKITIVSPQINETVESLAKNDNVTLHHREFIESDLQRVNLVFATTDNAKVNAHVRTLAESRGIWVNTSDKAENCSFISPSIIDRSPILIAMSSGGAGPVIVRYLRQKLETTIPAQFSKLAAFSQRFRNQVKATLSTVTQRRYFWEDVLEGDIAEAIMNGREDKAQQQFEKALVSASQNNKIQGEVYLVGAGPGDPDLLTFRALRLMQKADVVLYDKLVSEQVLALVRRDATKIYVGKAKSKHTLPQEDINQLMVKEARKGHRVVRLKGGDPFIFGRGGEEIETLVSQGIDFQVVPGITAAAGAGSYAGIPLTHRDYAQSVVFATGHLKDNTIDLNWKGLAQSNQTIVFYMGLTGLEIICSELVKHGLSASTPIALIESATRENQNVVTGTLEDICRNPLTAEVKTPTLIIVGGVVSLREKLSWYK